ncbi:MAG: glycosyltransferase [Muribaculaceae bacterium]
MDKRFTVTMCVYRNDDAQNFMRAVRSIYFEQTVKPDELIIVVDGPIPDKLESCISSIITEIPNVKIIRFARNQGHARARQAGLEAAENELVAIMDADDIAVSDRFEKQLYATDQYPETSVIGGQITEFIDNTTNVVGERIVPCTDSEIKKYLKSRCPMNLVTVMYKKKDVMAVEGFMDWYCEEDYYLWVRMALAGCRFANMPDTLVNVRVGEDMYRRRGGWKYFRSEARLQGYMLSHGLISLPRYCYNVFGRFVIQVAMPNKLRGFIFQKLFRK